MQSTTRRQTRPEAALTKAKSTMPSLSRPVNGPGAAVLMLLSGHGACATPDLAQA